MSAWASPTLRLLQIKELVQQIDNVRFHEQLTGQLTGGRGVRLPGNRAEGLSAQHDAIIRTFKESVDELNERFRRAGAPLNYHNGFIQISTDPLIEENVDKPFWHLVSDPTWGNVDTDMKEAIDQRDAGGADPAFYAARALESTIKIISDRKGWTHGGEKGASNFIDNLGSKKNGNFISEWEREALRAFFTEIRNPIGHGAGSVVMPKLTEQQTNWAIETCMSWIKSLIQRL